MAEKIRGKGVISGIAMGKIMLAGQNLDGYLVSYQPEDKETEKSKAKAALTAVAHFRAKTPQRWTEVRLILPAILPKTLLPQVRRTSVRYSLPMLSV